MDNLQGAKGADLCTDSAARAILFNGQVRIDQFKGALRADRDAAAAVSTDIPMYVEHSKDYVGLFPSLIVMIETRWGHGYLRITVEPDHHLLQKGSCG
jgi:hypothetical protein